MKILFAVSNENIAEAIKREYQNNYKSQLMTKNVYYFNAIIKELQNNKTYDVLVISEDLEPFANNNYDIIDKFLSEKLQTIREEAINTQGIAIPIIFLTSDRHTLGDFLTSKLYENGVYNALIGSDRTIENVCTLMFHPRNKQEAKNYYRVNVNFDNTPKEDDVKEEELKNILAHYKMLGKAEEKYSESFDNIASQYNDAQLKVIIRFLPLNVKAVLEAQSSKYQSLTTFANNYKPEDASVTAQTNIKEEIKEKNIDIDTTNTRVLEQISSIKHNSKIIVPNAMNVNKVRKIGKVDNIEGDESSLVNSNKNESNLLPGFEEESVVEQRNNLLPGFEEESVVEQPNNLLPGFEEESVEQLNEPLSGFEDFEDVVKNEETVLKRGRGRPKKIVDVENLAPEMPKKGRGRPKKVLNLIEEKINDSDSFRDEETNKENLTVGFADEIPAETVGAEEIEKSENPIVNNFEKSNEGIKENNISFSNPFDHIQKVNSVSENNTRYENIEYLISADKKIVSFVGTSKSGVSFIANNLAQMLSSFNINVALLDMTTNKNSFYIYTNNDEALRNKATKSTYNLVDGISDGIKINKNLTVYTGVPTDVEKIYKADKVLKTLLDNHSIILIDCDYETPIGYFDNSTDLFMVQNMDILTMQPLTTFLKELKSKNILKDEKLRLIINMETRVKGLNSQALLNAISTYKDPGMAYTIDLFNKMAVKLFSIPFDLDSYNKYLATLIDCDVSLNGYSKAILANLKEICGCIYPLISNANNKKNTAYMPPSLNDYSSPFSGNVNSTLGQMKNKY